MKDAKPANFLATPTLLLLLLSWQVFADFDAAAELYRQKNFVSAYNIFHDLARSGDPKAKTVLALMHKYGEGTHQDIVQAFKWYESAAEQGYPPAQFHTGNMYAEGTGTEQNREMAVHWLRLAADQGFDQAIDQLAQLNVEISQEDRSKELIAWSTNWNFRLPNSIRLGEPAPTTPLTLSTSDKFRIQVGAMESLASANRLWGILQNTHADLFAGLHPWFIPTESSMRRIYRIHTGSFANYEQASHFCLELLKHPVQAGCIPVKKE